MDDGRFGQPVDDDVQSLLRLSGPRLAPPSDSAARVRLAVREAWRSEVRRRARRRATIWYGAGLAAAAAAIVVAGPVVVPSLLPSNYSDPAVVVGAVEHVSGLVTMLSEGEAHVAAGQTLDSYSRIQTGPESYASLRLESGTTVRLDVDTRVSTAGGRLIVLERGAIYADSGQDVSGLEVHTPLGTARDIGTQFEARLSAGGLRVRVRTGRVRLDHRGLSEEAPPGVEITSTVTGPFVRRHVSSHGLEWDWTLRAAPAFVIEGRTLDAFLRWVEREGGWRVTSRDSDLLGSARAVVLHGSIDGLTPAEALGVVLPTCGLTHRLSGDDVIIERP